jgi:guanylate kinase
LNRGEHVILEIDWQGAQQIRKAMPECKSIFILPPSRQELERRLRGRGTDNEEVIARRLRDSVSDMTHWDEFDYVVINDEFNHALGSLATIVADKGEGFERERPELSAIVAGLLREK